MQLERLFDRIVMLAEGAAAAFLAFIALLTFVSVILRYVVGTVIPDGFDIGRLALGIAIFWGIAGAAYRNDHIQVDIVWAALPRTAQRLLDIFATLVIFGAMVVFAWMMLHQVISTRDSHQTTFDLHLPLWPFYGVAWIGLVLGAALVTIRLYRLLRSD